MRDCVHIIESADTVLDLATRLLQFCGSHAAKYHAHRPPERWRPEDAVRIEAELILQDEVDQRVSAEVRAALSRLVQQWRREAPDVPDVVLVRGILLALDIQYGHRWIAAYRRKPSRKLEPGDPVPVARPVWVATGPSENAIIEASLEANPDKRSDAVDRIPTLCLFPDGRRDVEIHLSPRFTDDGLPPVDSKHRVLAVGAPNRTMDDFRPTGTQAAVSPDGFFPFVPNNVEQQLVRVLRLIEHAAEAGAAILVLPELCLSPSMEAEILRSFQRAPRSLRVLVAGSCHVERDGKKRNESLTCLRGTPTPLRHHKFSNFFVEEADATIHEGIHVDPRKITLYLTDEGWTFTTLICKDLLDDDVRDLLRKLRVPLVLVPALTSKTRIFRTFAEELAASNQGIVLVANNAIAAPDDANRHLAIFATPRAARLQAVQRRSRGTPPQPGYFLHHLNETDVSWRSD